MGTAQSPAVTEAYILHHRGRCRLEIITAAAQTRLPSSPLCKLALVVQKLYKALKRSEPSSVHCSLPTNNCCVYRLAVLLGTLSEATLLGTLTGHFLRCRLTCYVYTLRPLYKVFWPATSLGAHTLTPSLSTCSKATLLGIQAGHHSRYTLTGLFMRSAVCLLYEVY